MITSRNRHRAILVSVLIFCGVVIMGIAATARHVIRDDRAASEQAAVTRADHLAQVYEQHVLHAVSDVDRALLYFREVHERDPNSFVERIAALKRLTFRDALLQISVISSAGRLLFSDLAPETEPLDLSDREHFKVHRDSTADALFISRPVVGRVSKSWSMQFTRRLASADGSFGGVIVLSLSPGHFVNYVGALDLGPSGGVTLLGSDGIIRARASGGGEDETAPGQALPFDRPMLAPGGPAIGHFWANSAPRGDPRLFAFRRLSDYPLIAIVHLSRSEAFARYEERRRLYLSTASVAGMTVILCAAVVLWLVYKQGQAQTGLEVTRQRLRTMLDNIPHMAWLKDRDGRFVAVNQALATAVGRPAERIVGLTDFDVWPADLAAKYRADDEEIMISGLRKDIEEEIVDTPNRRWFETFKTPVYGPNGVCLGTAGLARDVSERIQSQEALLAALETSSSILNALDSAVYVADMTTHEVLFANRVLRERFGSVKGRVCWQTVHSGQSAPCAFCSNDRLVDDRGNPTGIHVWEHFSRATGRWYECRDVAIPWGERGLVRLEIATDISHRKRMEDELKRSNADLEQFSYAISHDLQAPLRMVSSYLQLLVRRHREHLDEEAREFIGYAVDGANRMGGMIQGLLEYSRVTRKAEAFATVALDRVLDEALDNLRNDIEDRRAVIARQALPVVRGDGTQLMRLFQNLVGNALKYQSAAAVPNIDIAARRADEQWEIRIRDNGIGIAPDQFGRLFQVFQRLHAPTDYEGTGIGLALCRRIVERHGGRIWTESDGSGRGATFAFTLPTAI